MTKKFFLIQLFILGCVLANAQDLTSLVKSASKDKLSCDFSYALNFSGVDYKGDGSVILQDSCFVLKTKQLELYSDSKSLWIIDHDAEEVYIQPAEGLDLNKVLDSFDLDYKIVSVRKSAKETGTKSFVPELGSLSKKYVVTDLR